ncbi:unnamed protein product [Orchesella dallaii]|uniref:Transmembrane protein n=1 Tax=Orchesella dallaii TaxID=48710 RepID=A0ABP1Q217_9HEXA
MQKAMQFTRSPSFYCFSNYIHANSNVFLVGNKFSHSYTKSHPPGSFTRSMVFQSNQSKPPNFLVRKPNNVVIQLECQPRNGFKLFMRNYSSGSKSLFGTKAVERLHRRDGISKSYQLVYRSDLPNFLLATQAGVFVSLLALVFTGITYIVLGPLSEEEQVARRDEIRKQSEEKRQKERESELEKVISNIRTEKGWSEPRSDKGPQIEDLTEGGPAVYVMIITTVVFFAAALFRLQQLMPVRMYVNEKKHAVAVYYGHIVPGALTYHEFLAGTVRPLKGRLETGTTFKDGSGKKMILFERFFRNPADYNKIMGYDEEFMQEITKERLRGQHRTYNDKDRE